MVDNIISKIKDIIKYLKDAGFADASEKMSEVADALDDGMVDCLIDPFSSSNDVQMGRGRAGHGFGPAGPGLFSLDVGRVVAQTLIEMANNLDAKGCYEEADQLDVILADVNEMLEVIRKLDKTRKRNKKEKKKQKEEVAARSVGKKMDEVSNSFSGLSDAYFYSGYGNLEGPYGPTDR